MEIEQLLCYDALFIALITVSINVVVHFAKGASSKMTPEEMQLLQEYNEQVRIVNKLNSVQTFVEQSKATRKMNAIKKQMDGIAAERQRLAEPSPLQKRLDQVRTPLLLLFFLWLYWNEPIATFHQGTLFPLERLLASPGFPFGAISASAWALICHRVSTIE